MVKLVERMQSLHRQLAVAKSSHDKTVIKRQFAAAEWAESVIAALVDEGLRSRYRRPQTWPRQGHGMFAASRIVVFYP